VILTNNEEMPTQDVDRINKLEKKLKLTNLLTGKKFADLELAIGKLDENIKEVLTDFPGIKEKAEEIEDLLGVINLGVVSQKEELNALNSRLTEYERVPENVKTALVNYEKKLKPIEEKIKNISDNLNVLNTLKEDITKNVEENILPTIKALSETSERNKLDLEHIKKDMDTFNSAVKSFERTIELTNLDSMINRFSAIEKKIMETQAQLENLKNNVSTGSIKERDVEILKEKVGEAERIVVDKIGKLDSLETQLNILQQKIDDLNFFDTIKGLKSGTKEKDSIILQNQSRIDELTRRLDLLSQDIERRVQQIGEIRTTEKIEPEAAKLEHATTEETYTKVKEMYEDMVKRISELQSMDKELRSMELPPSLNNTLEKLEERVSKLDKHYNELVLMIEEDMKAIETEIAKSGKVEDAFDLKKEVEELQKILISRDKDLSNYRKQMEERLRRMEGRKTVTTAIPKNLVDELSSLKEMMTGLSAENKELKKVARDMRLSQMTTIDPETFGSFVEKLNTLEKKILEIEEMSKDSDAQAKRMEWMEKLKRDVGKVIEETKSQTKTMEDKLKKLEKKMSEESSVKPIILE